MIRALAACFILSASLLLAEDAQELKLGAPADWPGETITLPPRFAADMKLVGAEHIRFAPGMMKPASDTFFCYAFVFELQSKPVLTEAVVKEEFLKYYRGLCKAVLNGQAPEVDPAKFRIELEVVKPVEGDESEKSATNYVGSLDWVEPFATRKPQKLHIEIRTWSRKDRNYLFACVSPQARDAAIWKQLRLIRDEYLIKERK